MQPKAYTPKKRKSRQAAVLPLMLLFIGLLFVMYLVFPKEPGKRMGPSAYDGLVISEIMASNTFAVPDENGMFNDWLEIHNGTGRDLDLEDVSLTNRNQKITFAFPSYPLKADDRVIVFASGRYQLDPGMPFHGKFKITAAGDHLFMYDPEMYLIDDVATPSMTTDTSYQLKYVDTNGKKVYETTTFYSPGYENTEAGHAAYRSANSVERGALILNEICPAPRTGLTDEDNDRPDWVELRNTTHQPISLAGFFLSNNERKPMKWRFPEEAVIPANEYYLVFCSGKDKVQQNGVPHTNFSISAEKAVLELNDSYGRLVDRISIENVPKDYSVGRNSTGAWELFAVPTPGRGNDGARQ
ncbi:MAG: lamin tail domain-containing protein [Clostridia bacterium]|nr:lamin tail domain-containing protein [Clostridia bacterium]